MPKIYAFPLSRLAVMVFTMSHPFLAALHVVLILLLTLVELKLTRTDQTKIIEAKFAALPTTNLPWVVGVFVSLSRFHLPLYIYKKLEGPQITD